jgi:hypothetical protein
MLLKEMPAILIRCAVLCCCGTSQQSVGHDTVQKQDVSTLTYRLYSFQRVDFVENLQVDALSYLVTGKVVASLSQCGSSSVIASTL